MTKKLSQYEKSSRANRRMLLNHVKKLINDKNISVSYNYKNNYGWLPDGTPRYEIEHHIDLTWVTINKTRSKL